MGKRVGKMEEVGVTSQIKFGTIVIKGPYFNTKIGAL